MTLFCVLSYSVIDPAPLSVNLSPWITSFSTLDIFNIHAYTLINVGSLLDPRFRYLGALRYSELVLLARPPRRMAALVSLLLCRDILLLGPDSVELCFDKPFLHHDIDTILMCRRIESRKLGQK